MWRFTAIQNKSNFGHKNAFYFSFFARNDQNFSRCELNILIFRFFFTSKHCYLDKYEAKIQRNTSFWSLKLIYVSVEIP